MPTDLSMGMVGVWVVGICCERGAPIRGCLHAAYGPSRRRRLEIATAGGEKERSPDCRDGLGMARWCLVALYCKCLYIRQVWHGSG
jgi:hypothetical protein